MDKLKVDLINPQQAHKALMDTIWPTAKAHLVAGRRLVIELKPPKRSNPQNARLHAMLTELSDRAEWHGEKLPVDVWKRLATAAWLREEGQSPQLYAALDGHGVDIVYDQTSKLDTAQCGRLMEWITAFAAERGILLKVDQFINPETGEIL